MKMENLPVDGAENAAEMTQERKDELFEELIGNAVKTMANLHADTLTDAADADDGEADADPQPEATIVPPAAPPTDE